MKRKQTRHLILAKTYNKKGQLLATAINSYSKTHPMMLHFARLAGQSYRVYLHAEVAALLKSKDQEVYRLTVERYDADGNMALAKPCVVCQNAIRSYKVRVVEYTSSNGWIKEKV